jgi:hypothetical protein
VYSRNPSLFRVGAGLSVAFTCLLPQFGTPETIGSTSAILGFNSTFIQLYFDNNFAFYVNGAYQENFTYQTGDRVTIYYSGAGTVYYEVKGTTTFRSAEVATNTLTDFVNIRVSLDSNVGVKTFEFNGANLYTGGPRGPT